MRYSKSVTRRREGQKFLSRRRFLQGAAVVAAGASVPGCGSGAGGADSGPSTDAESGRDAADRDSAASADATLPDAGAHADAGSGLVKVATSRTATYERTAVRRAMEDMLSGIGGLSDVVRRGDRVAIKVNLTGGLDFEPPPGVSRIESFHTHPEVVRALGELLRDAGAGELLIVEALTDADVYGGSGYEEVAQGLSASLIDLDGAAPYAEFATQAVGPGSYIYESFTLNRVLQECDVFVSVAKMKCHCSSGVTLSMKNLVGLVPARFYTKNEYQWWRAAFHGPNEEVARQRLPRVILDLNRARPIHLAVVDGIKTAEGGELPQESCPNFSPVEPGVLVVSKDPVAADAVATAVMDLDPTAESGSSPFVRSDNYLTMARDLGLGTNRLEEMEIVGAPIEEIRFHFRPA